MKPTMEILARINKNSKANKEEIFTKMYRYLLRADIYYVAYKNLYANKGAATKGVNDDTADGFSEEKVQRIIHSLSNETYTPSPVRRTYIEKPNGKMRPISVPTFTDKLVQEALRMILEAVYEPVFSNYSHGFRPKRSCHTALKTLKNEFNGVRWFVEGDIRGCFDNIDHAILIGLIEKKIKDARIIKLMYKFMKAGYIENWQYYKTYSGCPQGSGCSPICANIYLHELDKFVTKLKAEFDCPAEHYLNPVYKKTEKQVYALKKKIKNADGEEKERLLSEYRETRAKMLKLPCKSQTDKKIKYIRYCDDFLIGVNGSREECEEIKGKLAEFMRETLKMELSDEKTLVTHSSNYARFLGYDVRVRREGKIKRGGGTNCKKRTLNNMTELVIPLDDKIHKFMFTKGIVRQKSDGTLTPIHRPELLRCTDLEIVSAYNAELRGICNYYSLASNYSKLVYFAYLMEYSCLKTLAGKHKTSISKTKRKHKDGKGNWGIQYDTKTGEKRCYFAKYGECKNADDANDIITNATLLYSNSVTSFEKRLKAKICELCGTSDSTLYEIHHVNKVKNLKGKKQWERVMIAKRRKTIAVCKECHINIHYS